MDQRKIATTLFLIIFIASLIIPFRIFFGWPLAHFWDYSSHIAGTKIMMDSGCSTIPIWGEYNICTKNAPGFYITSAIFSKIFGIQTGFVMGIFFYIALYFGLMWKILGQRNDKLLIILSLFGTSFSFWWLFKVGRVLEMTATVFGALFLVSDKKYKWIFATLAILHHPTVLIPLVLLAWKDFSEIGKAVLITSPYLFLLLKNASFVKWIGSINLVAFVNLFQAIIIVPFLFTISKLLLALYSESMVCSLFGWCIVHKIPFIQNSYAMTLIPLAIFKTVLSLSEKKKYNFILLIAVISTIFFVSREIYYFSEQGNVEMLLPMTSKEAWLREHLEQVDGVFSYSCTNLREYPSKMMVTSYAFVNYELEGLMSPFPEFFNPTNRTANYSFECPN